MTLTAHEPLREDGLHLGEAKVVRLKHTGRWIAVAVIVLIAAAVVYTLVTNPNFRWNVVGQFLFSPQIIAGLGVTLGLTIIAMIIGLVLGTLVALMRLAENPVLRFAGFAYVWFFRGVPLLVQLVFWYNISALFPRIEIGVPFGGPVFWSFSANDIITAFLAAILGLSLNQAAYNAEIIRSGIQSVDEGQLEAAKTLGISSWETTRRIVLPQAMRVIIPPIGNETITMLKTTSLVSIVAVADLLYSAQLIYARNFQTIPLLITASIWYLVLVSVLSVGQARLEQRFSRGTSRNQPVGMMKRLIGGRAGATPVITPGEPPTDVIPTVEKSKK